MGNYPDATAVFDVDAIGLVNIVHNLNCGLDIGGNPIGIGTSFVIGVGANPGFPRWTRKSSVSNTKFRREPSMVTQPVFDLGLLENFPAPDRALPDPGGRRDLAAGQRTAGVDHPGSNGHAGESRSGGGAGRGVSVGGNRDVTVRVLPEINHLMVHDPNGSFADYGKLASLSVSAVVLDEIGAWLEQRLR